VIAGDQLSGWKVQSMSLKPYRKPYCEIFYHGSVSVTSDPAPLVPADMRGPGITQVAADPQRKSFPHYCQILRHPSSRNAVARSRISAMLTTGTQDNCAILTNYTLAAPAALDSVYNATGLVIIIEVQRFFWCAVFYQTEACASQWPQLHRICRHVTSQSIE